MIMWVMFAITALLFLIQIRKITILPRVTELGMHVIAREILIATTIVTVPMPHYLNKTLAVVHLITPVLSARQENGALINVTLRL